MHIRSKIILAVILIFGSQYFSFAQTPKTEQIEEVIVMGRLVDSNHDAIPGAYLSLFWKCRACLDEQYPGTKTDDKGMFYLKGKSDQRDVTLFIDDIVPANSWAPLRSLSQERRKPLAELRGRKLTNSGLPIDLGDVVIPYRYAKVSIDLISVKRNGISQSTDGGLVLKIYDKLGRLVDSGQIPDSVISTNRASLILALPASRNSTYWKLVLSSRQPKAPSRKLTRFSVGLRPLECQRINIVDGVKSSCK